MSASATRLSLVTRSADLSKAEARRITLAAQGFADPIHDQPTMRTVQRVLRRTQVVQIDSVNVLQRAHFMPIYSRIGPYPVELLRRAAETKPRRVVEYWAHVQAFMSVDLWPLMRHRMQDYRERQHKWWSQIPASALKTLSDQVRDRGAVTARDLDDGAARQRDNWGWNWSQTRIALDFMFMTGDLAIAGRTSQFEPRYDLPDRVVGAQWYDAPEVSRAEQQRELVRRALGAMGLGTPRQIADYFRMKVADTSAALADLVNAGQATQISVEGSSRPVFLDPTARMPRQIRAATLLSPFDPVVWERSRAEWLFDFTYRIEIYTPAHLRVHGYYVLPFLLGDQIVARVDLKADRAARVLVVKSAHREQHAPDQTGERLFAELGRLAGWLDLDGIRIDPVGDLAGGLQSISASA